MISNMYVGQFVDIDDSEGLWMVTNLGTEDSRYFDVSFIRVPNHEDDSILYKAILGCSYPLEGITPYLLEER